jgi:hypothetical protein
MCLFSALILSVQIIAQQSGSPDSRISAILDRMSRGDLHAREAAFDDMMALMQEGQKQATDRAAVLTRFLKQYPDQADRIKLGLIQLLRADNADFQSPSTAPGTYTEDDTEHYAEAINVVSSMNDERAIQALAGAMTTGGMAQGGVLKYGDKAFAPVLEQLKSSDALVRSSALDMSFALLEKRGGPAAQAQIKELILAYIKDPGSVVRRSAVQEIGCLEDRQDFVPLLKEIAKSDPLKFPGKPLDGGDTDGFYPVRADARQVLRDIQNNEGCRHR